jgi:Cysteine-rich secretory protein family
VRTKFLRVIAAWLAVLAGLAGLALHAAPSAFADTVSDEAQFLALTNQLRSGLGIQTLATDGQLTTIARNWSAQMAGAGAISHNPNLPGQVTAKWTQLGENVGTGGTVQVIQTAFINSPHHYENLANGAYNFVGIGVAYGSNGAIYVTVDFMDLPAGASTPPVAPKTTAPRATTPRPATPAAPRVTTPPPASAPTSPPVTTPPPPTPARVPVAVRASPAFPQILEQLRSVDVN